MMADPLFVSNGLPRKFVMTPDSTLWMCAVSYLYRYSEKYSVPQVVLDLYSASLRNQVQSSVNFQIINHSSGVTLNSLHGGYWQTKILSPQGRIAWSGNVDGTKEVALKPGIWILVAKGPKGQSLKQTIAVVY